MISFSNVFVLNFFGKSFQKIIRGRKIRGSGAMAGKDGKKEKKSDGDVESKINEIIADGSGLGKLKFAFI